MNFAERMDLSDDHDLDWARHLDQRHTMARRRREILAEIRELPGFADFLRPPRCETLRQAAEAGPVVVLNVSRYGCDALIVTLDELRAVPLGFSLPEARRQADRRPCGGTSRSRMSLRATTPPTSACWPHWSRAPGSTSPATPSRNSPTLPGTADPARSATDSTRTGGAAIGGNAALPDPAVKSRHLPPKEACDVVRAL